MFQKYPTWRSGRSAYGVRTASWKPSIPSRVMESSGMQLQLGAFWFLLTTHAERKRKQKCAHGLSRGLCCVSSVFIVILRPHYMRTWRITVILIAEKPRIPPPPIEAPCLDKRSCRFWDLRSIHSSKITTCVTCNTVPYYTVSARLPTQKFLWSILAVIMWYLHSYSVGVPASVRYSKVTVELLRKSSTTTSVGIPV